jgi:uncharacterized protein YcbX
MPELSGLRCHPVKSCAGIELARAELDRLGIRFDRAWMVVDLAYRFLTQREVPALARIRPTLERDALRLAAPDAAPLALPLAGARGPLREVEVWRHRGPAVDQGDAAAAWIEAVIGRPCRLVRIPDDHERRVNPDRFAGEAHTAFSDGYPLLLASESSLADLNRRLPAPLPMNRFRPNLVVRGAPAGAEDGWKRIRIGAVELALVKPCPRCAIPSVDQETGRRTGVEPLRTLAEFRRGEEGALFGMNLVHLDRGELEVGMPVEVLA